MGGSSTMLIIYVVAFIAIFYFMAIRPQQRQRRAHQALLSSLKKGDHVITASGIYGTVKRVEETLVVVEVAKGVSMKVARNAIAQIVRDGTSARAFAPEPTAGRKGKGAPREIEEEVYVDEHEETTEVAEEEAGAEDVLEEEFAEEEAGEEEFVEEYADEAEAYEDEVADEAGTDEDEAADEAAADEDDAGDEGDTEVETEPEEKAVSKRRRPMKKS